MRMPDLRQLMQEQWQTQPLQTRVLVVHPLTRRRCDVVAEAIERGALYVRLKPNDSAPELISHFQDNVAVSTDSGQRHDVVLDECDRASSAEVLAFVRHVVVHFPRWRVILVTRHTPQRLFTDETLRPVMRYVPCIDGVARWDHLERAVERPWIEVSALGRGAVMVDGEPVTRWAGDLPRNLFFFLIERGIVRRSEIFSTFWPTLSFTDATNVFHVTKHKVAQLLGLAARPGVGSLTRWDGEFYHLTPELQIDYDVNEFRSLYSFSQVADSAEAILLLQNALALYRTDFLVTVDVGWAAERRAELRIMAGEAMAQLADHYQSIGDGERAYGSALRACAHDPVRQDYVRRVLLLARARGSGHDGVRVYDRLVAQISDGAAIAPDLTALAEAMR